MRRLVGLEPVERPLDQVLLHLLDRCDPERLLGRDEPVGDPELAVGQDDDVLIAMPTVHPRDDRRPVSSRTRTLSGVLTSAAEGGSGARGGPAASGLGMGAGGARQEIQERGWSARRFERRRAPEGEVAVRLARGREARARHGGIVDPGPGRAVHGPGRRPSRPGLRPDGGRGDLIARPRLPDYPIPSRPRGPPRQGLHHPPAGPSRCGRAPAPVMRPTRVRSIGSIASVPSGAHGLALPRDDPFESTNPFVAAEDGPVPRPRGVATPPGRSLAEGVTIGHVARPWGGTGQDAYRHPE